MATITSSNYYAPGVTFIGGRHGSAPSADGLIDLQMAFLKKRKATTFDDLYDQRHFTAHRGHPDDAPDWAVQRLAHNEQPDYC
jgi:hypothetical protein